MREEKRSSALQPVILAGGAGTRLWPLSRAATPKHLLPLLGERSLLQETVARLEGFPSEAPLVVCNATQRFLVAGQLRALAPEARLLLEPVGRNTAPALTAAALWAARAGDPLLLALPADHWIRDREAFHRALRRALPLAEDGQIVTFGVPARWPATGYGYIRRGEGQRVAAFVEKPDPETAQAYVASGDYLWNAGIFLTRASRWLEEVRRHAPEIHAACRQAVASARTEGNHVHLDPASFTACPSDSIDYAVMERTAQAAVVPLEAGWSDLGDWAALWEISEKDARGNAVRGDVLVHEVRDSLLHAGRRLVAVAGVEGLVVVETADAVLVVPREQAQAVKALVAALEAQDRPEARLPRRVRRPWGWFESLEHEEGFQVKRIVVAPGEILSLQKHRHRAEHWVVVRGTARVTRDEEVFDLGPGQATDIPLGAVHRLENPGSETLEVIEVQLGDYLGEDDIVRLEDRYQRSSQD